MKKLILILTLGLAAQITSAQSYYVGAGATMNSINKIDTDIIEHAGYYITVKTENKLNNYLGYTGFIQHTRRADNIFKMSTIDGGFTFNPYILKRLSLNLGFDIAIILSRKTKNSEAFERTHGIISGIAGITYDLGKFQVAARYQLPTEDIFRYSAQAGVNYRFH